MPQGSFPRTRGDQTWTYRGKNLTIYENDNGASVSVARCCCFPTANHRRLFEFTKIGDLSFHLDRYFLLYFLEISYTFAQRSASVENDSKRDEFEGIRLVFRSEYE